MKITRLILLAIITTLASCKKEKTDGSVAISTVKITPIKHGTLVLETNKDVIYIDPTGGKEAFKDQKKPTLVLITDIHGDHLDIKTLESLDLDDTMILGPKAVMEQLPKDLGKIMVTLNNGNLYNYKKLSIETIPMYNLREEALKFHPKGRGNGYVITINGERIYISGDTEDILEMRNLKDIDKAFVCMNLPYTMTVGSAASAVLEFKPKKVYPYHYRGTEGLSDINKFKSIVNEANETIDVIFLKWY
ncbi:MBL fold metallo-hydrolase [Winogradskyella sp. UBA3174]|uniref:MBL fold metallo-hydrolase n=1 Tax=Winogradskyella sp. UBA3174 TaxID=1947785 RepID=UPI0025EC2EE6|nr:MBL fold metallo-hydrolase [Winogradskyella sp. UBA3174]|tara:strand:- start:30890 stop:31633 length:744 start_codon:yes stop_codon:yes gene_type:complete